MHWTSLLSSTSLLAGRANPAADCAAQSAAIHNLTVYGAEILYTPAVNTEDSGNKTALDTTTSFEFQLYNAVLNVDAQCSTHVNQTSLATEWHGCFVESRDTRIAASFQFDLERHTFTVNETWVCDGEGGEKTPFEAVATNSIDLLCPETVNDAGQHYCARIESGPLPVNVTKIGGR